MKKIYCKIPKCLACRACEISCALAHSQAGNLPEALREARLPKSRIRVQAVDTEETLRWTSSIAVQCRHCQRPACVEACISGGITRDPKTGDIILNFEKCVGCWSCIMVCPIGAITKDGEANRALKCDHCPDLDEPACVSSCPTGALVFCEPEEVGEEKP